MKTIVKAIIFLSIFQLAVHSQLYACWPTGDVTWTGNTDSDWNKASNYSGNWGALPDNRDRVIINPSNYSNAPVISNNPSFSPASIYLNNGATLTVNRSVTSAYFEIGSGTNTVTIQSSRKLTVNEDFLLSSNNGRIIVEGGGNVEVSNDLIFENNGTRLTNNSSGNFEVKGDVELAAITSRLENNGNISITGDLKTGGALATANRIENNASGILTIGGDINFNGAANTVDNYGIVNQSGNFTGIDLLCDFDNHDGGTWNWLYTGGWPDPNMSSVLTPNGTVVYAGAGNQPVLPVAYNNLVISGSGTKQLQANTAVIGTMTLSNGKLALNDADLIIGSSATISNASSSRYIITNGTGKLIQNGIGAGGRTGNVLFPIGTSASSYTPLIINNSGTADNYSVRLGSVVYDGGYSGTAQTSDVVNKTWYIDEEVIGGSDVALTFQWNDADQLSGFSPTDVKVIHYDGAQWETMASGAATGSGTYTMTATNISSFSPFGIEGGAGTLPVELLYFKGDMTGDVAVLEWATASELNNDYFTVERTTDLENFDIVTTIKGKGTTEERNDYKYHDNKPLSGTVYYRLKQTDFDGTFTYSDIIKISNNSVSETAELNMYPVPNQGDQLTIRITGLTTEKETPVVVYNTQGQIVHQQQVVIENSSEVVLAFQEKLPVGVYTLRVNTAQPLTKQFSVR
ncbi:T9SS type A sorting domain-containing protein [Fulvivirga kasyanovii]|uniref:T9SS type A sorting domain-containing protein n=1 Tax=Fulvivirga kasyanovii TaxID=396812 RepID=A0ABW9RP48_9BACT|nr:T9SS type A sorting domain-containing protein [Fulvivirga kasyanovii]MTI25913.1 T9SS type A sorting domain-containing protein [Fulvivirga kasyanovii]